MLTKRQKTDKTKECKKNAKRRPAVPNEVFPGHRPVTSHPSSDIWYVRSRHGRAFRDAAEEHARRIVEALGLVSSRLFPRSRPSGTKVTASAFVGTNPTDEPITSGLLVIRQRECPVGTTSGASVPTVQEF
jgi:hypothetical protein